MNQQARYTQVIQTLYPNLSIQETTLDQSGQFNDVLFVNHDLIFRFPKVPSAVETLQREVAILKAIRDRVSLSIPNPIYHNLETNTIGQAFIGYPMLPGQPLWRETFATIHDEPILDRMAHQLTMFLHDLHSIPVTKIPMPLTLQDTPEQYANMYARIREKLFPHMRPGARPQVTDRFENYLNQRDRYTFEPALRHGDFGTGNLLYDPETGQITAVLDFSSAGLGDPAADFAGLLAGFGEPFFRRCASLDPEIEAALPRIRFYQGTFALEEALFGIENDNAEAFEAGIQQYR